VREVVLDGATRAEVARGLDLLARSQARGPLVDHIRLLLEAAECEPERDPSVLRHCATWAWRAYDRLLASAWFQGAVLLVFLGQAAVGVLAALLLGVPLQPTSWLDLFHLDQLPLRASLGLGGLGTSLASLGLVILGVVRLPYSRLGAYRWFERSLLVAILVTQVLLFWQDQLAALSGLFWNLALLTVLRYMIVEERARLYVGPATAGAEVS
jgi:hypothetical protein